MLETVEPKTFDVILTGVGPNRINTIKAHRLSTGTGLKEAKDWLDTVHLAGSARVGVYNRDIADVRNNFIEVGAVVSVLDTTSGEVMPALRQDRRAVNWKHIERDKFETVTRREEVANRVITGFGLAFEKLAPYKADIGFLRGEYKKLQPAETFRECRTWAEFCTKHLHRTDSAIRKMLAGPRKPYTNTLSRERRIAMATAQLDKLVRDDPARARSLGRHFLELASAGAGIVNRAMALPVALPTGRGIVTRIVDFVTQRNA